MGIGACRKVNSQTSGRPNWPLHVIRLSSLLHRLMIFASLMSSRSTKTPYSQRVKPSLPSRDVQVLWILLLQSHPLLSLDHRLNLPALTLRDKNLPHLALAIPIPKVIRDTTRPTLIERRSLNENLPTTNHPLLKRLVHYTTPSQLVSQSVKIASRRPKKTSIQITHQKFLFFSENTYP